MKTKKLRKDMGEHKIVSIDTGVFIAHFRGGEESELTQVVLSEIQKGTCAGVLSSICLTELMVRPLEAREAELADLYRVLLHEMPNLELVSIGPKIASKAAEIRASQKSGTAESLLLATAIVAGATAFITTEDDFKQARGIKVMVLDDYR